MTKLFIEDLYFELRFVKVGSYDGSAPVGQQLQIDHNTIVWTTGQSQVGLMPLIVMFCSLC